ncbi:chloride channel protein [Pseudomonas syringae]|uniref:chloride channel protein n=1 Tax=Pseudomonas syringae TaxID=317 RepID=UPI001EFCE708|nr:chloride channel protein [Pseudomonas syringae]
MGNGYEQITSLLHSSPTLYMLIGLLLLKILATAICVGSGSVGGLFTPTLLCGAVVGCILAILAQAITGIAENRFVYIFIGMAAMLSGVSRAPLTSIFMIFEMTGSASALIPISIASIFSTVFSRALNSPITYPSLDKHSTRSLNHESFAASKIEKLLIRQYGISIDTTVEKALRISDEQGYRFLHVVSASGSFLGAVCVNDIRNSLTAGSVCCSGSIESFLDANFPSARCTDTLQQVWLHFADKNIDRIPVVDATMKFTYLGVVSRSTMAVEVSRFV